MTAGSEPVTKAELNEVVAAIGGYIGKSHADLIDHAQQVNAGIAKIYADLNLVVGQVNEALADVRKGRVTSLEGVTHEELVVPSSVRRIQRDEAGNITVIEEFESVR